MIFQKYTEILQATGTLMGMKLLSEALRKSSRVFNSLLVAIAFCVPFVTFAQYGYGYGNGYGGAIPVTDLPSLFTFVLNFINGYVVPIVFAVAFVMFLFGVYTYFIAGGASEEKQGLGKQFVLWSVVGFVLMFSIWGLINIFLGTFALQNYQPVLPGFSAIIQNNPSQSNPAQQQSASDSTNCPAGDYFCQAVNNQSNSSQGSPSQPSQNTSAPTNCAPGDYLCQTSNNPTN